MGFPQHHQAPPYLHPRIKFEDERKLVKDMQKELRAPRKTANPLYKISRDYFNRGRDLYI